MGDKSKFKLLLFVFIFFISLAFVKCLQCPPPEDVSPCYCRNVSALGHIGCRRLQSAEKVTQVLNRIKEYKIGEFSLKESTMQYVPESIFNYAFQILEISFNNFQRLFEDIPIDPKIKVIWMEQVRLEDGWDWRPFSSLTKLITLRLKSIPLGGLSDFNQVTKSLQHIVFVECDVRKFNYDEFQHFPKLEMIDVQKDSITDLKRSMFAKPSKLQFMIFNDNFISTIPEDLFEEMPRLRLINLNNNRLSVLSENTFKPISRQKLLLYGNPLNCDCTMAWILGTKRGWVAGSCANPGYVQGKKLMQLSDEDFIEC